MTASMTATPPPKLYWARGDVEAGEPVIIASAGHLRFWIRPITAPFAQAYQLSVVDIARGGDHASAKFVSAEEAQSCALLLAWARGEDR